MITTELCLAVACALLLLVVGVIIAEVLLYKQFQKSNESSQQVSTELSKVSDNVRAVSKSIDTFTRIELMQKFTPEWDKDVWKRELEKLQEDDESS